MKTNQQYYILANNSPPNAALDDIIPTISDAYAWGIGVAFAVTGILLALSIANYMFRR